MMTCRGTRVYQEVLLYFLTSQASLWCLVWYCEDNQRNKWYQVAFLVPEVQWISVTQSMIWVNLMYIPNYSIIVSALKTLTSRGWQEAGVCVCVSVCEWWHPNFIPSTLSWNLPVKSWMKMVLVCSNCFNRVLKMSRMWMLGRSPSPNPCQNNVDGWSCLEQNSSVRVEFGILIWEE